MKVISLRILSTMLLVVAVLSLSGIVTTVEALVHAGDAACCNNDSPDKESGATPCPVPDCPCAFCLTIDAAYPPTVSRTTVGAVSFNPHQQRFPVSDFINLIEYPPEVS